MARRRSVGRLSAIGCVVGLALTALVAVLTGYVREDRSGVGELINVQGSPTSLAIGFGGIWIGTQSYQPNGLASGNLIRIDSASGRVVGGPINLPAAPVAIAVDRGAVRVVTHAAVSYGQESTVPRRAQNVVVKIDPASGTTMGNPTPIGENPVTLAAGAGAVWVANSRAVVYGLGGKPLIRGSDTVTKIDSVTNRVVGRLPINGKPTALAVGDGAIWLGVDRTTLRMVAGRPNYRRMSKNAVLHVDPERLAVTDPPIELDGVPQAVALGRDAVWVAVGGRDRQEIRRIDPDTNALTSKPILVRPMALAEEEAASLAIGAGIIWSASPGEDELTHIDEETMKLAGKPIIVGEGTRGLAVGAGSIWIADSDRGVVRRVALP